MPSRTDPESPAPRCPNGDPSLEHGLSRRVQSPTRLAALLLLAATGTAACTRETPPVATHAAATAELAAAQELFATRRPADLLAARDGFARATAQAPQSAAAWAGLAEAGALIGLYALEPADAAMPGAAEAALRALELDPTSASTWAALGLVRYLHDWDWPGAEEAFVRSIELDPDQANPRLWYAMMLSAIARPEDAVAQIERALEIAPDSRIVQTKAGTVFRSAGLYQRAGSQLEDCVARWPEAGLGYRELGYLALAEADPTEALSYFERAAELSGGESRSSGGLGHALALLGREDEARRVLDALEVHAEETFVPPMYMALVHAGFDDPEEVDRAFARLDEALDLRDPGLVYLTTKPGFERLAGDPRFAEMVRRIGLPTDS